MDKQGKKIKSINLLHDRSEPITRREAKYLGRKIYLSTPCRRGHDGWRYTSSRDCVDCQKESARDRFDTSETDIANKKKMDDLMFDREIAKILSNGY